MGLAKLCGFLTTSVLLFILLVDSIAGIRWRVPGPKETLCTFPVVIRGAYQNAYRKGKPSNFKIFGVFKSPRELGNNVKIYRTGQVNPNPCYYTPEDVRVEFIVYGLMHKRRIICMGSERMDALYTDTAKAVAEIVISGC
ncbi:UNVERIFIED_CONTAM: hypothetical protein K2H54_047582 [Gekko kuhli]